MARQTTVTLVDDLDGSEVFLYACRNSGRSSRVSRFCLRRPPPGAPAAPPPRATSDRAQNQAIREWAIAQGMKVSERGRIPTNVLTAYHSAH